MISINKKKTLQKVNSLGYKTEKSIFYIKFDKKKIKNIKIKNKKNKKN